MESKTKTKKPDDKMISWEGVVLQTKVKPQTKGTVLLVCWKCTDILLFASKHAKACPYVMMQF
ncbi:MAG: hypothetical protein MR747_03530 [Bacteroidales bacterium]|nr:hypothetical protein [Bacteroidales bacterium]